MVATAMHHIRQHGSLLAAPEKRLLVWIAVRLPRWINSDHLTLLALLAMAAAGAAFAVARVVPDALWVVPFALAVNWFGDSLDGTLARVRRAERPRYGFYVDHVLDLAGITLLAGGLACSGYMTPLVAVALLIAYLLVSAEVFLATAAHGMFRMSFLWLGPTELRILLATGTMALFGDPQVDLGALGRHQLFDVGGVAAAAGLALAFLSATVRNTRILSRMEPMIRDPQSAIRAPQASRGHPQPVLRSPQSTVLDRQSAVRDQQGIGDDPLPGVRGPQSANRT
ncbi:MAG: CDP-alcohol phosphatidyltransferase family protein [Vicinamibacterales bacterium]